MIIRNILTATLVAAFAATGTTQAQTKPKDDNNRADFRAHFRSTDKNSDGGISKQELGAADAKNFPLMSRHFDEMDANKDGKVTMEEHDAWVKKHPEAADKLKERRAASK
jgi:Ca2+-binding EF-hand superfamily protein